MWIFNMIWTKFCQVSNTPDRAHYVSYRFDGVFYIDFQNNLSNFMPFIILCFGRVCLLRLCLCVLCSSCCFIRGRAAPTVAAPTWQSQPSPTTLVDKAKTKRCGNVKYTSELYYSIIICVCIVVLVVLVCIAVITNIGLNIVTNYIFNNNVAIITLHYSVGVYTLKSINKLFALYSILVGCTTT